jgi:hypothetical protein
MNESNFYDFLNEDRNIIKNLINSLPEEESLFLKQYLASAEKPEATALLMTICYKLGRLMTTNLKEEIYVN